MYRLSDKLKYRISNRFVDNLRLLVCSFVLILPAHAQSTSALDTSAQSCLKAAQKELGPDAEVLKCGHLTETDALETVAAVRLKQFRSKADAVPIAKLAVLRQDSPEWRVELAVDKQSIRNSAGFIEELNSIAGTFIGYRASLSDHGSDDSVAGGFTVWLYFLHASGQNEGVPLEISWNRSVGRFQEFSYEGDPKVFKPEITNPRKP